MKSLGFGLLLAAGLLAGCANQPAPNNTKLDTGIGATGSAGQSGGSAAAPTGTGSVTTTHP